MLKDILKDLKILRKKYNVSYFKAFISNRGFHSLLFYRIAHKLYNLKIPLIPLILTRIIQILYAIDIDYRSEIKGGVVIVHGVCTVIGSGARIEEGVVIYHQVTIGIKGSKKNDGFAEIGKNCILGAGAKILGKISIGDNVIIGANTVITKNIPDDMIVYQDTKLKFKKNVNS